jgi:DNA-cytosine methyltransferase
MSCGQLALKKAGIHYNNYYASEIDKHAIIVSMENFPQTKHIGDITKIRAKNLPKIDLIIGGSPCQGFSFAGKQLNFNDPRSKLFFEFVRLIKECSPKFFLLENVRMKKEFQDVISKHLGVKPVTINSATVSGQNRVRLYWTNIPNITQPKDKNIFLKDIIESGSVDRDKSFCLDANYFKGTNLEQYLKKKRRQIVFTYSSSGRGNGRVEARYNPSPKKALTLTAGGYSTRSFTGVADKSIRKLSVTECKRLQTIPDNYKMNVSNTQAYKMLGNGWTVDVIAHIFKGLKQMEKKTSEEKLHSTYGASGSKQWMTCVGSIQMSEGMPNYENEASKDGTLAHACLEFLLKNRKNKKAAAQMAAKTWQEHHIKYGLETVEYIEELLGHWKVADKPNALYIETEIDASKFTRDGEFGTLDLGIDASEQKTLIIGDYKFGAGISVHPKDNPQLVYYALGMLLKLGWKKFDKVILIVMQPRKANEEGETNHVWETTTENILSWGKKFKAAVKRSEAPGAITNLTSGDHCQFCLARIKCPKLKDEALKQAQIDFAPSTNVIKKLPELSKVDDIGKMLDACEKLKVFIKAVEERAYNDAKRGKKVNGWKLVEKRTTRSWKNEQTAAKVAKKVLGELAFTEPKLLSPAQFEKKFAKNKKAKAWLQNNVTNKTGGTTLARSDNKKKEINIFEAEFTVVE